MRLELFKHIYFRLPVLVRLFITILLVMLVFGITIHFVEPKQFPTIFTGIWWAFVTAGTVGYGDFVPLTTTGRMIGIILILSGAGLLTFYISIFAAATVKHERDLSKGKVNFKGSQHIIIVGWNERTRKLVNLLQQTKPHEEIVLIDRTLSYLSYQHYPLHFIHGDVTDDQTLKQANIQQAKRVIITADHSQQEADQFTILATLAIRGNNDDVPITVEILAKKQVENALRAGANAIVQPNDFIGGLLFHELFGKKYGKSFEITQTLLSQQQFSLLPIPNHLVKHTFIDTVTALHETHHILIIGFVRDNNWFINPNSIDTMNKQDILITMVPWNLEK
ncbi:potassium channel family protein [Virgibacillus soli]|uniref:Potassium channel family protein n=1 Tax=Paracerasibacillus soli TaxID=480284 RepID=A0ABU5CQY8_9BACI|nr:potassium channel family protein [Virgibacillus soli]MDY0408766.1 potassium channel family protein [Virgibacillus soli]